MSTTKLNNKALQILFDKRVVYHIFFYTRLPKNSTIAVSLYKIFVHFVFEMSYHFIHSQALWLVWLGLWFKLKLKRCTLKYHHENHGDYYTLNALVGNNLSLHWMMVAVGPNQIIIITSPLDLISSGSVTIFAFFLLLTLCEIILQILVEIIRPNSFQRERYFIFLM